MHYITITNNLGGAEGFPFFLCSQHVPLTSQWVLIRFSICSLGSKCVPQGCSGLSKEIGFSAPNSCNVPWLVKAATQLCTKKECNKLELTTTQYFWLVDHNDWSRWFVISSSHVFAVPVPVLLVGLPKRKS
jgi:hypothetical protein